MNLAVFGDLHGNSAATSAVLNDIDAAKPDAISCLGDLVGYGARPNEVIDIIRGRAIPTLMGNYDDGVGFDRDDCGCAYKTEEERERGQRSLMWSRAVVTRENKQFLQALPFDIRFKTERTSVRLVHGSPRRINEYLFEDRDERSLERITRSAGCDTLIFGHTHKPWARAIAGVWMVNAGSAGKPKDGDPRACWALVTIESGKPPVINFRRVAYDVAAITAAIRAEDGLPNEFADDLETGGAPS